MMEFLLEWDRSLLLLINQGMATEWLDIVLPVMRDKLVWVPVYVFILSFILFNLKRKQVLLALLMVTLTMVLSDTTSSKIVKPSVERVRPCNNDIIRPMLILRVRCGGGYSFTSSHSTNHFALSTILFLLIGKGFRWKWLLFVWAGIIALSQVYVGVHYPADILSGAVLGLMIGCIVYFTLRSWWVKGFETEASESEAAN